MFNPSINGIEGGQLKSFLGFVLANSAVTNTDCFGKSLQSEGLDKDGRYVCVGCHNKINKTFIE